MINSPTSNSSISIDSPLKVCKVCAKPAHGRHFGAFTCRACATFFRRYSVANYFKACSKNGQCEFLKNGYFNCKTCRLERCWQIGMKNDKFQTLENSKPKKLKIKSEKIPLTIGNFIGRSNLIIFCAPQNYYPKQVIDVRFLLEKASNTLKKGVETPLIASSSLEKLAFGLQRIRRSQKETKLIHKLGKNEFLALWQDDMLKIAKWLTYFDEFQLLPHQLKIQILKGIWRVWCRLDRLATTMIGRNSKMCQENMMMLDLEENHVVFSTNNTEIDLSWMSNYNVQQLKLFGYKYLDEKTEEIIQKMITLEPSDVELSFMMCQLCFYYVGKRYQGTIMEVADRLLEVLASDLHDYYSKHLNTRKYSLRISNMMKINNQIQQGIYQRRAKADLMRIFDVFYIEYSDPEMFVDA